MRTGYAIRDRHDHGWLKTRTRVEGVPCAVTIFTLDEDEAMQFSSLKDARRMLKVVRAEHRRPDKVHVVDPRWRVIV